MLNVKSKDVSYSTHTFDISVNDLTTGSWTNTSLFFTSGGGDIAFGTSDNNKPTTSYVHEGASISSADAYYDFPVADKIYDNGISSTIFSIRATERGTQDEHIRIWNGGYIFFR